MRYLSIIVLFFSVSHSCVIAQERVDQFTRFLEQTNHETISDRVSLVEAERILAEQDWGIHMHAHYQERWGDGFIEDDIEQSMSQRIYRVGVDWDILKSGYMASRLKAKELASKVRIEELNESKRAKESLYVYRFALLADLFEHESRELLLERIGILEDQNSHFIRLREDGHVLPETVIRIEQRLEEVTLRYASSRAYSDSFSSIFQDQGPEYRSFRIGDAPRYYLDLTGAQETLSNDPQRMEEIRLQQHIIEQKHHLANQVSLNASLDYNRAHRFDNRNRDFASVRVSLKVPLSPKRNATRNWERQSISNLQQLVMEEQLNAKKELLMLYSAYVYKQKQFVTLEKDLELVQERIRVDIVQRTSISEGEPIARPLLLHDDAVAIRLEMLELKKQLLQDLLRMDRMLHVPITHFLEAIHTDGSSEPAEPGIAVLKQQR